MNVSLYNLTANMNASPAKGKPNFPALRAVGCKVPRKKKKKEKLSGREYGKISVKRLCERLLI